MEIVPLEAADLQLGLAGTDAVELEHFRLILHTFSAFGMRPCGDPEGPASDTDG